MISDGNFMLLTFDGSVFEKNEPFPLHRVWWSNEFNRSGLHFDIGTRARTRYIFWVNIPYHAGQCPDLRMARGSLNQLLDAGKRNIIDGCP